VALLRFPLLAVLALILGALPSAALTVETESFGYADFPRLSTWAWANGAPSSNPAAERHLRTGIESWMTRRGWRKIEGSNPHIHLRTVAANYRAFTVGRLQVEVFDSRSRKLAWRGTATEIAPPDLTEKKIFKDFPKAGG